MSDETPQDGEICPVCGQEYAHYRVEEPDDGIHSLRDDATQCKVEIDEEYPHKRTYKVYVHV